MSTIIDPATTLTGGGWASASLGHGGSVNYFAPGGSGANTALWSATGLTPGTPIYLAITWPAAPERPNNVPVTVYDSDGTTVLFSGTINQQVAASDFADDGVGWKSLGSGTFSPTSTSLHVKITDAGSGYGVADAVWYDTVPPPVSFSGSNPAIIYGGRFTDPYSSAGTMLIQKATGAEYRFNVTGTQLKLGVYGDGSTFSYSVDGGSFTDSAPNSGLALLTIFTGLSDTSHTVVIKAGNYTDYTNMLVVVGAAPALTAPSGYSAQHVVKTADGFSVDNSYDRFGSTPTEGYIGLMNRGSFRFKATTDTIRVWCRAETGTAKIGLCVDGDADNITTATAADTYGWVSFSGLDGNAEHTYRVITGPSVFYYSAMASGVNATPLTPWPADYYQGDSIVAGSTIADNDIFNWPARVGLLTNRGWQIKGTAGGTAVTQGVAQKASPGDSTPVPENVFLEWGYNDHGGYSDATFRAAVTEILTQVAADLPSAKIRWLGIFPGSAANAFTTPTRAAMNTAISEQVAAFADADVTYVNTDSLSVVATSDSTHPNATGAAAIGDFLAALVEPPTGKRMDNRFLCPR